MLPKKNRADKKDIDLLFKTGRFLATPALTFRFILTKKNTVPRISFIAPKSVAKLAVKRNLLRRRGYSALKNSIGQLPLGAVGAFTFKKYEENISVLSNEIKDILAKVN